MLESCLLLCVDLCGIAEQDAVCFNFKMYGYQRAAVEQLI